eukprot:TRINITY_DN2332_c0_g2_i7.p1 TRINITY_DN2332_c0_g2~~TRINITY_DN2332_c0_g2_i7.p1  ORF type:complete len:230 (-),score=21.11 TRINITY_DN2332_c0_g2_i7:213-902(-)
MLGQFSMFGTVWWNFLITVQILYLLSTDRFDYYTDHSRCNYVAHLIVWPLATASALTPSLLNQYVGTPSGCWIGQTYKLARLLCFVLPLYIVVVGCVLTLVVAIFKRDEIKLRMIYIEQLGSTEEVKQFPTFRLLIGYTLLFLVFWIPPLCLRTLELFGAKHRTPEPLILLDIICCSFQGIGNLILCLNFQFIRGLVKMCFVVGYVDVSEIIPNSTVSLVKEVEETSEW